MVKCKIIQISELPLKERIVQSSKNAPNFGPAVKAVEECNISVQSRVLEQVKEDVVTESGQQDFMSLLVAQLNF